MHVMADHRGASPNAVPSPIEKFAITSIYLILIYPSVLVAIFLTYHNRYSWTSLYNIRFFGSFLVLWVLGCLAPMTVIATAMAATSVGHAKFIVRPLRMLLWINHFLLAYFAISVCIGYMQTVDPGWEYPSGISQWPLAAFVVWVGDAEDMLFVVSTKFMTLRLAGGHQVQTSAAEPTQRSSQQAQGETVDVTTPNV